MSGDPEQFRFDLPSQFTRLELRGEGSEQMRAPAGASVRDTGDGFSVEAGPNFALEVVPQAPPLSALSAGDGVARVLAESDVVVFKSERGYSFVVSRELVPEWDEGARRRLACASAGGAAQGVVSASTRGFSKSAVEQMVAACRTLELPSLE